jgi:hypothetical protein
VIKIIHLDASPESLEFHGREDDGVRIFAAHSALEVIPETKAETDDDDAAKASFVAFAKTVRQQDFVLLAPDGGDWVAKALITPITGRSGPPDLIKILDRKKNMMWELLKEELGDKTKHYFYRSANFDAYKKIAGEVTAINVRKTDATMVLRSSLNWIAPVPQKLGLTSIVEIDETDWEKDKRLLVPFAGEDYEDVTFDVTVPDASDGAYRVTYEHGSQLGEVTCRTDLLENYTAPGGSLRFMADGWVSSDPEAAEFFRLKARVEERSASLLVCYHSLLSYPTPPPRKPDQIGVSRDKKDGYPDLDPSQIRWLATAGFVSLFDTLLIGLRMPMRVTQPGIVTPGPRSTLLTALHGLLMSALETAKPDEGESEESVPEEEPVWDMLYKHVLEAMSDWVDDGWQGMRDLLREEDWDRAPKLKKYFDSKLESEIDHATVVAELSELALILEDEAGLEAVLVKILDRAIVEKSLAGKLGLADGGYLRTALSEAFAAFKLFLDQQLNAAEILRRDVGRAVMRALGDYAKTHQQDSMRKDIEKALQTADWFVRLLNGPVVVDPPALDHLSTGLDKSGSSTFQVELLEFLKA